MLNRFLVISWLMFTNLALADSWARPTPLVVSSPDTRIIVRIEPGGNTKAVGKYAPLTKTDSARAAFFRFEDSPENYSRYLSIALSNPVNPVSAYVSNDGALVTLDNYGNPGQGDIVSIYDPRGKLVHTYKIEDIYADTAISEMRRSVSTREWRHPDYPPRFSNGDFLIADVFGNFLFFSTSDGSLAVKGEKSDHVRKDFR
jgi:hypothetical protein